MSFKFSSICLLLVFASFWRSSDSQIVNSIEQPIIKNSAFVHTREYAQIPDEDGAPAKIVCLIPFSRSLFVCTLTKIYLVQRNGNASLFIDLESAIATASGGRQLDTTNRVHGGVRSIAFSPNFWRTGLIYVSAMETRPSNPSDFHYVSDVSNPIDADSVLLEFRYDFRRRFVDPQTYRSVFRVGMPVYDHTIRQMAFYRGELYIAHGDGSEQDATVGGGQNGDARGKILRIIPYSRSGGLPYAIPNSNPFVGDSNMPDEVYALGFRNPHHICFGRDGTLYVADTGRSNVEEINLVKAGRNYGWSKREGTFVHSGNGLIVGIDQLPDDDAKFGYDYPNAQVGHDGEVGSGFTGQAIAGGCPVENGSSMSGRYWYGDFPKTGRLFYSDVDELKNAVTRGDPDQLTQARTHEVVVCLERNGQTTRVETLGGAVRADPKFASAGRADIRFGRLSTGELVWSSKTNGKIFLFLSSQQGGPSSSC